MKSEIKRIGGVNYELKSIGVVGEVRWLSETCGVDIGHHMSGTICSTPTHRTTIT